MLEPINARNMPGYFLNDFGSADELIAELAPEPETAVRHLSSPDHAWRRGHGLRQLMPIIGHIQIASVPSRHEPDGEELNYPYLFEEIDRLGYGGFVGCEYNPRAKTPTAWAGSDLLPEQADDAFCLDPLPTITPARPILPTR